MSEKEITISEAKVLFEKITEISKQEGISIREAYKIVCKQEGVTGYIVLQDSE